MSNNTDITQRYNDGDYLEKNRDWHLEDAPWKATLIDEILTHNQIHIKSMCEIGCGTGEILKQLSMNQKYQSVFFSGYEISNDAFDLCKTRESDNLKFYCNDLLENDTKFDVVLCIDVFEHVENYMGFLQRLRTKADYKVFHIPLDLSVSSLFRGTMLRARDSVGHLHYFTPDTAVATLKDCGYKIEDVMYTPAFSASPPKTLKAKLAKLPRMILYKISPKLMSTLIGGVSLMVLAK